MIVRYVNLASAPVNLTPGIQSYAISGLTNVSQMSNPANPQVQVTLMGDGTEIISAVPGPIVGTTCTVTFSAPIPNSNWFLGWFIS